MQFQMMARIILRKEHFLKNLIIEISQKLKKVMFLSNFWKTKSF